jgi:hypothetical protein
MEDGWRAVRAEQRVGGVSPVVTVRPVRLSAGEVTVTIEVGPDAPDTVWFPDGLYGATAWAWDGGAWRRADTAEMRIMMAPSLEPGQQATVTLPLAGSPSPVRVLVPDPPAGLGAWADVR